MVRCLDYVCFPVKYVDQHTFHIILGAGGTIHSIGKGNITDYGDFLLSNSEKSITLPIFSPIAVCHDGRSYCIIVDTHHLRYSYSSQSMYALEECTYDHGGDTYAWKW